MANKITVLNVGISLLIIILLAMIASDVIAHRLSRVFPSSVKKSRPVVRAVKGNDLLSFSPILEKGLFGKAAQGTLTPIAQSEGPAAASSDDLTLLGTAVGSFRETFALVLRRSTQEEKVFRLGDKVFDIGPLLSVRKEMIEIGSGTTRVKLMAPSADPAEAAKDSAAPAAPGGMVTKVGAGSYVIDQRALAAAIDNPGQMMTDARLLPSARDGKVEGFNVSEVKPAGIFGMIGLKNGDMLMKINDFAIDSPDRAMQSLLGVKGQNRLKIDLMRDGKPLTLNYDIR